MTAMMIRRARPDDLPACARIVTDWERAQDYLPEPPPVAEITAMFQAVMDDRCIWVVGDPVTGYLSLDPGTGKVGAIFVTRPGQGLGKGLMDHAKAGRDHLWLTVYQANRAAQHFYRREGFEQTEIVKGDRPGEPDMYRMDWHAEAAA